MEYFLGQLFAEYFFRVTLRLPVLKSCGAPSAQLIPSPTHTQPSLTPSQAHP